MLNNKQISRLKPDTDYMARIAIYKEYSTRTLGKSTAVIEFKTSSKSNTQLHLQNGKHMMTCNFLIKSTER